MQNTDEEFKKKFDLNELELIKPVKPIKSEENLISSEKPSPPIQEKKSKRDRLPPKNGGIKKKKFHYD